MNIKEYAETLLQARRITGVLTSNRYSRRRPDDMNVLENIVRSAIIEDKPLELLGLWGGSKEGIPGDENDRACLKHLDTLQDDLREHYVNTGISLLYCDLHHYFANNVGRTEIEKYFSAIEPLTKLPLIRLSDEFHEIQGCMLKITTMTDHTSRIGTGKIFESNPTQQLLISGAQKHSRLVHKNMEAEDIARMYVELEIFFLRQLHARRSRTIFFSFSNPDVQEPIAQAAGVPMVYLNPYGTGEHRVPWYQAK